MTRIFEITEYLECLKKEMIGCLKKWGARMEGKREACLKALEADDRKHTADTAFAAAAALGEYAYDAASGTDAEEVEELSGDILDIIFCLRYREIYEHAPDMPEGRIRYFCQVLLRLLPYMNTGDHEIQKFAYSDFICIYTDGILETVSVWLGSDANAESVYKETQAKCYFNTDAAPKEILELCLLDTLNHLLFIENETNDTGRKGFFLDLCKLSGLFQEILDVFSQWADKDDAEGMPYYNIFKIGSWIPDFLQEP